MNLNESAGLRSLLCSLLILLNVACAQRGRAGVQDAAATTAQVTSAPQRVEQAPVGYYQYPAVRGDLLVFCAEGDLWSVPLQGGRARRLTTHHGDETNPAISFDGRWIAFTAQYEGPTEVYVMPATGGLPTRLTFDGMRDYVVGWTPEGKVMYRTSAYSTLPGYQLATVDPASLEVTLLPLAQASQGVFDEAGRTLFFTRFAFQGSHTKRYAGGTAQDLWRYTMGEEEAFPLTADYDGTSRDAMWARGRVYFASDRDGTMNIWSMKPDGGDLQQHTRHVGWDVKEPSCDGSHVVYQLGADIHALDLASDADRVIAIGLTSDFDQQRERWVTSPMDYLTAAHISPDGDRVALTARGEVFVAPVGPGRLMTITRDKSARHRDARFLPDGERVLTLSDESGEVEFWTYPANGLGESKQLTNGAEILRWEGVPSPDGKYLAHHDKKQRLWLHDFETGQDQVIDEITDSFWDAFTGLTWSPDSRYLAYAALAPNTFQQVKIYDVAGGAVHDATSVRYDSYSPAWSKDGKWLYFLSDRTFRSWTGSPWGPRAPQPYFPETTKIYYLALGLDQRSPFAPDNELITEKKKQEEAAKKEKEKQEKEKKKEEPAEQPSPTPEPDENVEQPAPQDGAAQPPAEGPQDPAEERKAQEKEEEEPFSIVWDGLAERLYEAPVAAANMFGLFIAGERLYWFERAPGPGQQPELKTMSITNKSPKPETFASGVSIGELSKDGKKILLRKGSTLYVVDAGASAALKSENEVNLSGWALNFDPRIEWRQMFTEAWRLERDYFYDSAMHGVDWQAMREKYLPLVDRVTTRAELSDLLAQMVGEVSALHIFVYGGDLRRGEESIGIATLGARLVRDNQAGGWRVEHIYEADPDEPSSRSPLDEPGVDVVEGDVITMVNGVSLADPGANLASLLRYKAGQQVRLRIVHTEGDATTERDVIVQPIPSQAERSLRYDQWEYTRRRRVEDKGDGEIGYVHLRSMGGGDIGQWTRDFFPVFDRKGLIIDVRHNTGGNIDSWILGQLMRRAWMYWSGRRGEPAWNMQYAFRGHMVVLCDESTASDGEAFAEGFRRLGLGKVIGTRTWGGEIWLSSSNVLVDTGIATAAEFGVYGPEGEWLIEGRGVEPDIIVDNPPHETFKGADAQLDAAIEHLLKRIAEEPIVVPPQPAKPNKASPDNRRK